MAKRFYKYFPWLFIAVELLFIFILLGLLTWANSGVVFFLPVFGLI